jgi:hypothetical protein
VLPQNPPPEQHFPKVDPTHVLPLLPHLPSVEILPEPLLQVPNPARQPAPQCWLVVPQKLPEEQQVPKVDPVHVFPLVPHWPSVEMLPEPLPQVPEPDWQPAPQWSVVVPQNPPEEQQVPKVDPVHVFPMLLPHRPSVEMLPEPLPQPVPKPD